MALLAVGLASMFFSDNSRSHFMKRASEHEGRVSEADVSEDVRAAAAKVEWSEAQGALAAPGSSEPRRQKKVAKKASAGPPVDEDGAQQQPRPTAPAKVSAGHDEVDHGSEPPGPPTASPTVSPAVQHHPRSRSASSASMGGTRRKSGSQAGLDLDQLEIEDVAADVPLPASDDLATRAAHFFDELGGKLDRPTLDRNQARLRNSGLVTHAHSAGLKTALDLLLEQASDRRVGKSDFVRAIVEAQEQRALP